jgi:2-polyprenyl-6-methoxyphenol hydroxylase-like FAD-dependent oxidoreductase
VRQVLIVGGGIAGLSLAIGLERHGLACEVIEKAPAWAPAGAGIGLAMTGMLVLRALGVSDAIAARGHRIRTGVITDALGRVLSRTRVDGLEVAFAETIAIHRADLHDALLRAASGVELRMGTTLDALESTSECARVRFSDGSTGEFALVVGADGLHSRVRELALPGAEPRYVGYTAWRTVVPRPPGLADMVEMWGRGLRLGITPIDAGRAYAYASANEPEGAEDPPGARIAQLRRRFGGFAGHAQAVLGQLTREDQILRSDLFELRAPRWHAGRAVLVGDAAHAMAPDLGQGASMALEDVLVLSRRLAALEPPFAAPALAAALQAWEAERRPRVTRLQAQSRRLGRFLQRPNPWLCAVRDLALRGVPERIGVASLASIARGSPAC